MATEHLTGFESAVRDALDAQGTGLLGRPQGFLGTMEDLCDQDSPEVVVLEYHCGEELLRPFAEAAGAGTTDALATAARRAELLLRAARRVNADDALTVAWGIARGAAAHLGVALPRYPGEVDERTEGVLARGRAVLADSGAGERDVEGALAGLRALPEGTQGAGGLVAALEKKLGELVANRRRLEEELQRAEAARRAEEARRVTEESARRWREEQARQAEERRRRETEDAARKEAEHKATKNDDKPAARGVGVVLVTIIVCVALVITLFVALIASGRTRIGWGYHETPVVQADDAKVVVQEKGVSAYSWDELKDISTEIANAGSDEEGLKIAGKYNLVGSDGKLVGDTKAVTLTDGTEAHVRILGFRHDELAGGGRAGITFEFADVPAEHCMNPEFTSSGGWEASEMREWLNSEFLELLPEDLRACVEPVKKRTNNTGYVERGGDASVVTTTIDNLWLPSVREVYGDMPSRWDEAAIYNAEGIQYQLYADQGVTFSIHDYCKKGGANLRWWLRSPSYIYEGFFHIAAYAGDFSSTNAYATQDVYPGFCF